MEKILVKLKNGQAVLGDQFQSEDLPKLSKIYKLWVELSKLLKELGGRTINVPDILSEGLYCLYFNAVRTNNTASSYDVVSVEDGSGIQIKSTSIETDLTSFGPGSKWDKLIFMDFLPNGVLDGNIWVYEINENLGGLILNESKNETFENQQAQGKRPRLSIKKEFIRSTSLQPIKKINILN